MASYGAGKYGRAGGTDAIVVGGFAELQRALRLTELGVQTEVQTRILAIGEYVKQAAISNVPHKTGRHGPGPTIESAMKVSAVVRGASVYTLAPQGGAINVGAWSKGRGPHIKRGGASHYMNRAVTSSRPFVEEQTQAVLDWITTTFEEN